MTEEIIKRFDSIASKYDSQRKYLIPCFDDFYKITLELIEIKKENANLLDIGCGTGLLTNIIYSKFKNINFTLIDISNEMLSVARKRFAGLKNFKFITADYKKYQFDEKYDVVVSGLSIHHLDDKNKNHLYKKIFNLLKQNGIFINADQISGSSKYTEKINREKWLDKIEKSPLTKEEKTSAYNRMKLDKMATLKDNIKMLENSGFRYVDLFYKYYNFAVIYCKK